jgi:hypothetical protein
MAWGLPWYDMDLVCHYLAAGPETGTGGMMRAEGFTSGEDDIRG